MRILYTIMAYGPHIIASEVHSELGREFRAAGHDFAVLSLADYATGGEAGAALFEDEAALVQLYKLSFGNSGWLRPWRRLNSRLFKYAFFLELVWGLARWLRRHRTAFDLVHVEAAYPLGSAWALAAFLSRSRLPFVLNLQGADVMSLPRYDYGYGRYWLPRQLLRLAMRRCAGVRANSEQTAELALSLGADPARLRVIYRNISDAVFPAAQSDLAHNRDVQQTLLRQRYGLRPGPVVLAMSRLHPFKGLDFLVEAVPKLLERWPDLNVVICGPSRRTPQFGDYREYLERLAERLGVRENLFFTGKVDFAQSADHLAGADLLVVPSVVEALNKVVIEAAAVGTPSVITRTTGIARPAVAGGVGVAVEPTDAAALAEAIGTLLADDRLRQELGERGPLWAKAFSSREIAFQLLDFYRVCLAPARRLAYVAYPSSLTLKSANAIQTFSTCRELRRLTPDTLVLLPRLPGRPSRFKEIGARHLLRWPFNVFNNIKVLRAVPWSYVERTFFSFEVGLYLLGRRLTGRGLRAIYVRDVICAYWLIRVWRKLLGAKIIYEAHDLEARNPSRAKNPLLRRWLERVDRTVIGESDILVSLTGTFLEYVQKDTTLRSPGTSQKPPQSSAQAVKPVESRQPASSFVIPDAYDAEAYQPLAQAEARQELGIGPDEFVIVYSGLTFAYRNLDKLVDAFAAFLKTHPDALARLLFAGGRPFEQTALTEQAARLGLGERVQCIGQHPPPKINLYLNAASLLAIPDTVTDLTASPLKLFEYAAVARPVLLPDIAALKEILPPSTAVYFERGSTAGMLAGLEWVYQNQAEANARATAARAVVARYTYANRAQAILDLLLFNIPKS